MARNEEKANSMLHRFLLAKENILKVKEKRPYLASECRLLPDAERWRMQIVREVSKKVAQIQNASMGENRIRDINDEINKLMREKSHWERRIVELGGANYGRSAPPMLDVDGHEVKRTGRYFYFGAAKSLPGVKELFEQAAAPKPKKRIRFEILKGIDTDYYGYRDEDDGVIVDLERARESEDRSDAERIWKETHPGKEISVGDDDDLEYELAQPFAQPIDLPDPRELEERVLESRKRELLARYATTDIRVMSARREEDVNMTE